MSADPLNANPTILSASDLPTRRRRRPSSHANVGAFSALFSNSIARSSHSSDPFATSPTSTLDSDSEDDAVVDRIDEQEIYGMTTASPKLPQQPCVFALSQSTRDEQDEFFRREDASVLVCGDRALRHDDLILGVSSPVAN